MTYLAKIYVTLKPAVSDPAGQTVLAALRRMGHEDAEDARIGKYLELKVNGGAKESVENSVRPDVPGTTLQSRHRGLPLRT